MSWEKQYQHQMGKPLGICNNSNRFYITFLLIIICCLELGDLMARQQFCTHYFSMLLFVNINGQTRCVHLMIAMLFSRANLFHFGCNKTVYVFLQIKLCIIRYSELKLAAASFQGGGFIGQRRISRSWILDPRGALFALPLNEPLGFFK